MEKNLQMAKDEESLSEKLDSDDDSSLASIF